MTETEKLENGEGVHPSLKDFVFKQQLPNLKARIRMRRLTGLSGDFKATALNTWLLLEFFKEWNIP